MGLTDTFGAAHGVPFLLMLLIQNGALHIHCAEELTVVFGLSSF